MPFRLLDGYRGYLQVDGYDGYNAVGLRSDIVLVGCMAHARRKFDEAVKAQGAHPDNPREDRQGRGRASRHPSALSDRARKQRLFPEERYTVRQQNAKPLLDTLRASLDTALPTVPSQTMIGNALTYLHNQWPKLMRYLDDGRLSIDNNPVENAIRPFVIGRRNWLFSDTARGAKSSANLYSLIETAKANGLEPYAYSPPLHRVAQGPDPRTDRGAVAVRVKTQPLRPPSPE